MKESLRTKYRMLRKNIDNKTMKDRLVCNNFLNSDIYKNAKIILAYYPLKEEINILSIIKQAIFDRKLVALPKCLNKNGDMEFYYIKSLEDVESGLFNIKEPTGDKKVKDFRDAILLTPGFTFDNWGYRVGYGKGYYDRYLSKHKILSVGLCYEEFLEDKIDIDLNDMKVNYICTDKVLKKIEMYSII